jgi:hypothetical protein
MDLRNLASIIKIGYGLTGGMMGFPPGSYPAACPDSSNTVAGISNSNNEIVGVF